MHVVFLALFNHQYSFHLVKLKSLYNGQDLKIMEVVKSMIMKSREMNSLLRLDGLKLTQLVFTLEMIHTPSHLLGRQNIYIFINY